jgi:threonine 3-dehydrogenase
VKAVVKPGLAPGAEIREVAIPTIGPRDVLLKIKAVAICGSDIHIYHSSPTMMSLARPPLIFGHEACGEVVEVGEQVTGLALGDLVAVETHIPCGTCYQCQTGGQHVCERLTIFGVQTDGAFAEYARVPEIVCWKLSRDTSPDLGAILEPLGVAVHGVTSGEIGGRSVAIFGCGPVGILALQAATALGATRVFAVEIVPARLKLAYQCAPSAVLINPEKVDPVEAILEASGGQGVDVCLEYSGSGQALKQALKVVRRRGRVSLVGVPSGPIELDVHPDIILKETRLLGISGRLIWQSWWQVSELLASGRLDPMQVITHRFPLADFATAIELAAGGETGKIVLYP